MTFFESLIIINILKIGQSCIKDISKKFDKIFSKSQDRYSFIDKLKDI